MIRLDTILSTLYADQSATELKDWMETHAVMEPIKRAVSQLNMHLSVQDQLVKECRVLPIGHIATYLLITFNERIARETDPDKVRTLENILSDIAVAVLTDLFKQIRYPSAVSIQIKIALKDTCEMFNYDYSQLIKFLKLDSNISYLNSLQQSEKAVVAPQVPSYIWKRKEADKPSFISIFSERKLFLKKAGLALLFEKPNECLDLAYNPAQTNLTLQFFANLKKHRIITHIGCDGFYKVLSYHIKDFDNIFLKNREAGSRLNALKQSTAQWNDNQQRIEKWLAPYI